MGGGEASLGRSVPSETPHAVSVYLPTWRTNVGYEEGEEWVISKLTTGYPRFFINEKVKELSSAVLRNLGLSEEQALLFPSAHSAKRCVEFITKTDDSGDVEKMRIVNFVRSSKLVDNETSKLPQFSSVIFPQTCFKAAKSFWQHTGEGMSSRRAEFCKRMLDSGALIPSNRENSDSTTSKGPKRYRKLDSPTVGIRSTSASGASQSPASDANGEPNDLHRFVEERFGRNFDINLANQAKLAIKRRIVGSLTANRSLPEALSLSEGQHLRDRELSIDDVYLYPSGMSSIYNSHRMVTILNDSLRSICYGFPYLDTLKVLQKFGPGCLFYGHGSSEDLDDLEKRLEDGERFSSLFCEFPSNPLLKCPDLERIRSLADRFKFLIVIDETIGNFLNVQVLPYADILVSSLTKIFSGDSNVMGGSAILNPRGPKYSALKEMWDINYEDHYWPDDAIFMERNSRDFVSRIERINRNAEAICQLLEAHSRVKQVYYPKTSSTRGFYDRCRTKNGGYGGLLSATFYSTEDAATFYDNLETEKGPSLGTNFTLASPFVLIAHYTELEWAAQFGVEKNLIRFSVGLEDTAELQEKVSKALKQLCGDT